MNGRITQTIAVARTARQRIAIAGVLAVNVSSNYKKLSRSLDQVGRKQLPFAFAKTLNKTMKAAEKYTVARTSPRGFDVRNRAFFKASMFTGTALRREMKTTLRVAARDQFDRGNLQLHATGGTKRARSGRIAIPSRFTKATRGARGVRKALLPRAVVYAPRVSSTATVSGHSTRIGKAQDCVAAGISIGAIMRDGGWRSEAMVARYTEHLQVKQGASAILAARQARL